MKLRGKERGKPIAKILHFPAFTLLFWPKIQSFTKKDKAVIFSCFFLTNYQFGEPSYAVLHF